MSCFFNFLIFVLFTLTFMQKSFAALPPEAILERNRDAVHFIMSVENIVINRKNEYSNNCRLYGKIENILNTGTSEFTGSNALRRAGVKDYSDSQFKYKNGDVFFVDVSCNSYTGYTFSLPIEKIKNSKLIEFWGEVIISGILDNNLNKEFEPFDAKILH